MMYELDYEPVRLTDFNNYFVKYKVTNDERYFKEFLHFYEPMLDRKAKTFIDRFELEDYRAEDLKQIFTLILWEKLQNYDSEIPLLQIIKFKVINAWHEYVRINCGNFQTDNKNQYRLLRKIAFLYYQKSAVNKPLDDIITEIVDETKLTYDSVRNLLNVVTIFKPKYNADWR